MERDNRRFTLLGSSNVLNTSRNTGVAHGGKSVPPSASRMASRRMSVVPQASGPGLTGTVQRRAPPGVKGDPRPVGDKGYQAACARNVLEFLTSHGYEYQVTLKTVASPTTKDYTNIMMFIVRYLDPSILKGFTKIEEEIPQLYKRLRYPFTISKSNLTAVGSPHTWPSILAALSWVVELINYCEKAEHVRMDGADDRTRMEAGFLTTCPSRTSPSCPATTRGARRLTRRKGRRSKARPSR